jgi:CCR4-NOT transcriptional regulation complex NOT5 subunit
LEPWLDDNKKKLKDKWANKVNEMKMILKHMEIGNYKQFKFFHTWQHAKHGAGFEG